MDGGWAGGYLLVTSENNPLYGQGAYGHGTACITALARYSHGHRVTSAAPSVIKMVRAGHSARLILTTRILLTHLRMRLRLRLRSHLMQSPIYDPHI